MANMMAFPELRHPFEPTALHGEGQATVIYNGKHVNVTDGGATDELLINPSDLLAVNGFEIKPEGACLDDLCIPLTPELTVHKDGQDWFNVSAFADLLEQPYVADLEARVWSFAEIPANRENRLLNAMVPDIEVTDRSGNVIRLADLKGKKALIVTWSSW